jgi:DMSO/TMAO reductase YedYZ molybdopterin-dependent catalytic subunit
MVASMTNLVSRRTTLRAAAGTAAGTAFAGSPAARAATDGPILKPLPARCFVDFGTNAEMRWDSVAPGKYLTDSSRLFVRDHTSTPRIDAHGYRLAVFGDGLRESRTEAGAVGLSLADLRSLRRTTITAVHECTGNGRSYFDTQQHQPAAGTQWTMGAVGAVTWTGVRLADLFARIGLAPDAVDVMATGLDPHYVSGGVDYGAVRRPFPVAKALGDALLAWEMNGRTLLPDHGFPLRLVLPGWVGIASIKWLGSLEVARRPLTSPWNTKWYRMTGPSYPADSPPLTVLPVRTAWELPAFADLPADAGKLLHGRSWSGAGRIAKVDVSTDGGGTWLPAQLTEPGQAWTRWRFRWPGATTGQHTLMARATDVAGRTQPLVTPYNDGGYFFDAVVRQQVRVA